MNKIKLERMPVSMEEARLWAGEDLQARHKMVLLELGQIFSTEMSVKNRAKAVDNLLLTFAMDMGLIAAKYKVYMLVLNPSMN